MTKDGKFYLYVLIFVIASFYIDPLFFETTHGLTQHDAIIHPTNENNERTHESLRGHIQAKEYTIFAQHFNDFAG